MKELFPNNINKSAVGKNSESLAKSRQIRSEFKSKYGIIPTTILKHDRKKPIDLSVDNGRKYNDVSQLKDINQLRKLEIKQAKNSFKKSGMCCRGKKGALSTFPQTIGKLIVEFYCSEKGTVYDPFAGHNSRMQLVYECNRNYIGVDISKEFMRNNYKIKNTLLKKHKNELIKNDSWIKLIYGSSDKVDLQNEIADFTITSPPYWNLEWYGDEEKQLGKNKTYQVFLNSLFLHIQENYRILKSGSFCCWFVNDFVKNKIFYPYHCDVIDLFKKAGFTPFQIDIVDLGPPIQASFIQHIIKTKRFAKQHEYCLVFQK